MLSWQPSLIFFSILTNSRSIIQPCTLKLFQITKRLHTTGYWSTGYIWLVWYFTSFRKDIFFMLVYHGLVWTRQFLLHRLSISVKFCLSPWHFIYWRWLKLLPTLQWRHNGRDGVSNHQPHHCLLNCLLRCRSKKTQKLRATGLCAGDSPVTDEFPAQMGQWHGKCFHLMTSSWCRKNNICRVKQIDD